MPLKRMMQGWISQGLFRQKGPTIIGLFALLVLPFVHLGASIDPHHTCAFVAFSLALVLVLVDRNNQVQFSSLNSLVIMVVVLGVAMVFGKDAEDFLLLTFIVFLLALRVELKGIPGFLHVFWSVFACVLTLLLVQMIVRGGFMSHEESYAVQPLFAHRNIALESFAILSFAHAQGRRFKSRLFILSLAVSFALVFQSRAALLAAIVAWVLLLVPKLWINRRFRWMSLLFILAITTFQAYHCFLPWDAYKKSFDRLPDVLKAVDLRYNVASATSSSERMKIWKWSVNETTMFGHGLGSWKFDAQGAVNQAIGKERLVVRRPHSEFIRGIYEFGWIPFGLVLLLFGYRFRHRWRLMTVAFPVFLFSFPLERAEHLSVLWLAAAAQPSIEEHTKVLRKRWLPNVLSTVFLLFFVTWAYSQHIYGKLMHGAVTLRNLPSKERIVLEVFSHDPALNRLLTYQLVELKQRGRTFSSGELERLVLPEMRNELWYLKLTTETH